MMRRTTIVCLAGLALFTASCLSFGFKPVSPDPRLEVDRVQHDFGTCAYALDSELPTGCVADASWAASKRPRAEVSEPSAQALRNYPSNGENRSGL